MSSPRIAIGVPCLILAGVLCLYTSSVHAQDTERSDLFKPYLSAGLSSAQISGDELSGFKQLGFNFALGTEIDVQGQLKPSIEVQFDQRGSRKNARPDEGDLESYLLRLNYIQVPLLVGFRKGSTGFELGLAPGYLISLYEENEIGEVAPLGREFESYDLGALAGLRYRFHDRLELATRYQQSIIPVRDHAGGAVFRINRGQYSSSIQFSVRFHV